MGISGLGYRIFWVLEGPLALPRRTSNGPGHSLGALGGGVGVGV